MTHPFTLSENYVPLKCASKAWSTTLKPKESLTDWITHYYTIHVGKLTREHLNLAVHNERLHCLLCYKNKTKRNNTFSGLGE